MNDHLKFTWMICCSVLLFSSACSGISKVTESVGSTKQPEETINALLADPRKGLDGLKSYHMEFVNEFNGESDGKSQQFRLESIGDEVRDSQTEFVSIRQVFSGEEDYYLLSGVVGNASYSRQGDETTVCHVAWNQERAGAPTLWPVDMLPFLLSGKKGGSETINSIQANHFSFEKDSLGISDAEKFSGDVWLAEPEGYVVKLEMTLSGGEKTFGKGRSGTQKLTYDLTRINSNDDYALPAGCQPVLTDLPVMPDATRLNRMPETVRYVSTSTEDAALAFYKSEMSKLGWKAGDPHPKADGGQIIVFFKPDETDTVQISFSKGTSGLLVTVSKVKAPVIDQNRRPTETNNSNVTQGNPFDPATAGLPDDVEIYPGAKDFSGFQGRQLGFYTTDSKDKVIAFYQTSLKKASWSQLPGTENLPDAPMIFQKGGSMILLQVGEENNQTKVTISKVK
jgi:hypothetical protein